MSISLSAIQKPFIIICLMLSCPILGFAEGQSQSTINIIRNWQLNTPKTKAQFAIKYLYNASLKGMFNKVNGAIQYNAKQPLNSQINFEVDTTSIDTGLSARDLFLQRQSLLNTAQYPTMTFVSKHIDLITPKIAKVRGDFTALGQTKPLTIKVTLSDVQTDTLTQQSIIKFDAVGVVNRHDYGVTAFSNIIGTQIPIHITGELVPVK